MQFTQEQIRGFVDTVLSQNVACYDDGHYQGLLTPELLGTMHQVQCKQYKGNAQQVYLVPNWAYVTGLGDDIDDFVDLDDETYDDMVNYYKSSEGVFPPGKENIIISLFVGMDNQIKSVMLGMF